MPRKGDYKTMRKANTVIVKYDILYNGYRLLGLTVVNRNGDFITLCDYKDEKAHAYLYEDFSDLYKSVLNLIKQNGFYTAYYEQFGARWYNIAWLTEKDFTPRKYSILENEEEG